MFPPGMKMAAAIPEPVVIRWLTFCALEGVGDQ